MKRIVRITSVMLGILLLHSCSKPYPELRAVEWRKDIKSSSLQYYAPSMIDAASNFGPSVPFIQDLDGIYDVSVFTTYPPYNYYEEEVDTSQASAEVAVDADSTKDNNANAAYAVKLDEFKVQLDDLRQKVKDADLISLIPGMGRQSGMQILGSREGDNVNYIMIVQDNELEVRIIEIRGDHLNRMLVKAMMRQMFSPSANNLPFNHDGTRN